MFLTKIYVFIVQFRSMVWQHSVESVILCFLSKV